jgi:hypothetical protein
MKFHAIENAKNYLFTGRCSKHGDFNFPETCCLGVEKIGPRFHPYFSLAVLIWP